METTKINCPNCGNELNVEDVLSHRIEEKYKQEFGGKISELEKSYQAKDQLVKQRELELKKQSEDMERQIAAKVAEQAQAIATTKAAELQAKIKEEYETQLKSLTEADAESKKKITEMKNTLIENERLKRQLDSQKQDMELQFEQQLTKRLEEEAGTIRQREKESSELKVKELEKKLDDQVKLVDEMKRKAEQGSMQMQGEVQEIALEKMLRELYEIEGDEIEEVKKGQRGADVIHVVKTRQGDICGKICYESKRTKTFDEKWLQKLRDDNLEVNADILVIVTEAMPPGQDRFFCKDSVWICSFWEIKGLSMVLRYAIMQAHAVSVVQQGKDTKMEMIYDYLTGNEFAGQFGAILEGFKALQDNYNLERLRMETIWKERDKQLTKILTNTARFYGSIKGIAGQSIPNIKMLEGETPSLLEG